MRKKAIFIIAIALIVIFSSACIDRKEQQPQEIGSVILHTLGLEGDIQKTDVAYEIMDNRFLGIWTLVVKHHRLSQKLPAQPVYSVMVDGKTYLLTRNPADQSLLTAHISDSHTPESIRAGQIRTQVPRPPSAGKPREGIHIQSVVIQKAQAQHGTDLFRVELELFLDFRSARVFVFDDQDRFISPSYITSSEGLSYTTQDFMDARSIVTSNSIHNTFVFLKTRTNHEEILQRIHPNVVDYQNGTVIVSGPKKWTLHGTVKDEDTLQPISDARVMYVVHNVEGEIIHASQVRTNPTGEYEILLDANTYGDFAHIHLSVSKEEYQIENHLVLINEFVDHQFERDIQLSEIPIPPSERISATVDLPEVPMRTIVSALSLGSDNPVHEGSFVTDRNNLSPGFLSTADDRVLGIWYPTENQARRGSLSVDSETIIEDLCLFLITSISSLEEDNIFEEIKSYIRNHALFASTVALYNDHVQAHDFDLFENIEIIENCVAIIDDLTMDEDPISPRGEHFVYPDILKTSALGSRWIMGFENYYPFYLAVAKADGEFLGLIEYATYEADKILGFIPKSFSKKPKATELNTYKVFDRYFEDKSIYYFIGIGSEMPEGLPEDVLRKFRLYNGMVGLLNRYLMVADLASFVASVLTGVPFPVLMDSLFSNLDTLMGDVDNQIGLGSVDALFSEIYGSGLDWLTDFRNAQKASGVFLSYVYQTAKTMGLNPEWNIGNVSVMAKYLRKGAKGAGSILKGLNVVSLITSAIEKGGVAGWRLAYFTHGFIGGVEYGLKPYTPYEIEDCTGYFWILELSTPETIYTNEPASFAVRGRARTTGFDPFNLMQSWKIGDAEHYFIQGEALEENSFNTPVELIFDTAGEHEVKVLVNVNFLEGSNIVGSLLSATRTSITVIDRTVQQYTLTLTSNNEEWGTVSGGGTYPAGEIVTIKATANEGYRFVNWTKDGAEISKEEEHGYTMPAENVTLVANFEERLEPVDPGEMVRVNRGTFQMGDEVGDLWSWTRPVHTVTLTYDYWIGKYEVTFDQYDVFCDATPGISKPSDEGWGRGTRPVIRVSWWDAIAYCNWLSEQNGLARAYDSEGNLLDRDGEITTDITQVEGYRLPTEAEWEYAASGGHEATNPRFRYAGSNTIGDVAWYRANSDADGTGRKTQPVGGKDANELGLHDMSGNVWEWCHDRYGSYTSDNKTDPIGPSTGSSRVQRGGGWIFGARSCRVANRDYYSPGLTNYNLGFRITRTHF